MRTAVCVARLFPVPPAQMAPPATDRRTPLSAGAGQMVPDDSKPHLADHQFVSPQTTVLQAPTPLRYDY